MPEPSSELTLRPAQQADLRAAQALLESVSLTTSGLADQWGEQYAVLVTRSGELAGVAGFEVHGRNGLLRSVAVAPDWRGQGLGAALTADRVSAAKQRGLHSLFALTTTAAEYFPRLGFQEVPRDEVPAEVQESSEFSWICPSTAAVLRLDLAETASAPAGVPSGDAARPAADPGAAIRTAVRQRYGAAARRVSQSTSSSGCCPPATAACCAPAQPSCCGPAPAQASCCGPESSCCGGGGSPITSDLYDVLQTDGLPSAAVLASLGCGNPTALAELKPGEVVLDLGSGGGIDVLLSARRVGPSGKAYGLDMTPDMLNLARRNAREAGVDNVEFLRGEIENIPLPAASVDVIISNCVINLSSDKGRVLQEAFRVLRPGGRFAVSDIVVQGTLPEPVRRNMALWVSCVAGALEETEFRSLLAAAGFVDIEIEPTRVYSPDDLRAIGLADGELDLSNAEGQLISAFVRATKPGVA